MLRFHHITLWPFPSQKIIAFFTCCCLWFSASAGYLKSYFAITDFKVSYLMHTFPSLWPKGGGKKQQKKPQRIPPCLFMPKLCILTSVLICVQRTNTFYLTDLHWKSVHFFLIVYELFHQLSLVGKLFWKSEAIMCELRFALYDGGSYVPIRDIVC